MAEALHYLVAPMKKMSRKIVVSQDFSDRVKASKIYKSGLQVDISELSSRCKMSSGNQSSAALLEIQLLKDILLFFLKYWGEVEGMTVIISKLFESIFINHAPHNSMRFFIEAVFGHARTPQARATSADHLRRSIAQTNSTTYRFSYNVSQLKLAREKWKSAVNKPLQHVESDLPLRVKQQAADLANLKKEKFEAVQRALQLWFQNREQEREVKQL